MLWADMMDDTTEASFKSLQVNKLLNESKPAADIKVMIVLYHFTLKKTKLSYLLRIPANSEATAARSAAQALLLL